MTVHEIDPLQDERWAALVQSDSRSSMFHSVEWLQALHRVYGYTVRVFTTSQIDAALTDGIVFCEVNSWITGRRLVSLPFSDHCEPLARGSDDLQLLLEKIKAAAHNLKYAEIRTVSTELQPSWSLDVYNRDYLHVVDLRNTVQELYEHLHYNSIRRKIRRAEREHIVVEHGRSESLLREFYQLQILTRRRHHLPPQPFAWFRELTKCFGPKLTIHVARLNGRAIASIITVRHKYVLTYKYGCSDNLFHRLGAIPYLFWEVMQEAKAAGVTTFDLGRSEQSNIGLIRFKERLGATRVSLNYWRTRSPISSRTGSHVRAASRLLSCLPQTLLRFAGEILYRHVG
jgi:hypothetical protein